jgi:hypothetical protein
MDVTTRFIAIGISCAIAAVLREIWRGRKRREIDASGPDSANVAAKWRKRENRLFIWGGLFCAINVAIGYVLIQSLPEPPRKIVGIVRDRDGKPLFTVPAPKH